MDTTTAQTALITGGTAGLGLALTRALVAAGWTVVADGRRPERAEALPDGVRFLAGDITDPDHRAELVATVADLGRLDLLVNNASTLGPLPMGLLAEASAADLEEVLRTNVVAPFALTGELLPHLRAADGAILSISSDVVLQHYETWGLYAASKAALDHLTLTYGAEAGLTAWAVDPGDMRTDMHQDAFPGEDISDRPDPETVVPHLIHLVESRPGTGRYTAKELS